MTPALEKLAELVRQAEAKTRARKIEGETQHAAEQFRAAELRARRAVERLRTCAAGRPPGPGAGRPRRAIAQGAGAQAGAVQVVADLGGRRRAADRGLAGGDRADARRRRRLDLEEVTREVEEARRELRVATDQYRPAPPRDRPAPARAGRAVRRRGPAALGRRGPFPRRPAPAPGPRGRRRPRTRSARWASSSSTPGSRSGSAASATTRRPTTATPR